MSAAICVEAAPIPLMGQQQNLRQRYRRRIITPWFGEVSNGAHRGAEGTKKGISSKLWALIIEVERRTGRDIKAYPPTAIYFVMSGIDWTSLPDFVRPYFVINHYRSAFSPIIIDDNQIGFPID